MTLYSTTAHFSSTQADTLALMRANPRIMFAFLSGMRARVVEALSLVTAQTPRELLADSAALSAHAEMTRRVAALPQALLAASASHESRASALTSAQQVATARAHLDGNVRAVVSPRHVGRVETKTLPYTISEGSVQLGGSLLHFGPAGSTVTFADVSRRVPNAERNVVVRISGAGALPDDVPTPSMLHVGDGPPAILYADMVPAIRELFRAIPDTRWVVTQESAVLPYAGGTARGDLLSAASRRAHISTDVDVGDVIDGAVVTATVGTEVTLSVPVTPGERSVQYGGWRAWSALVKVAQPLDVPTTNEAAIATLLAAQQQMADLSALPRHTVGGRTLDLLDRVKRAHLGSGADIGLHTLQRCAIEEYAQLDHTTASTARLRAATADAMR